MSTKPGAGQTFTVTPGFFTGIGFRLNSVASRAFILLLAQNHPSSFISGNKIDLRKVLKAYNRNEFHHIYPRNYLKTSGQENGFEEFLFREYLHPSKADNNLISGVAPSEYRKKMPSDITPIAKTNFLPESTFDDHYSSFVNARAMLLADFAKTLT